jgi:hypothetical protein
MACYVLPHSATVDDIEKLTAATNANLDFVSSIAEDPKVKVIALIVVPGHKTPMILEVLLTIESGVHVLTTGEAHDVGLVDVSSTFQATTVEHPHIAEGTRPVDVHLVVTPIKPMGNINGQRVSPVQQEG